MRKDPEPEARSRDAFGEMVHVTDEDDVLEAMRKAGELCARLDFAPAERTLTVSAVSQLGRHLQSSGRSGSIHLQSVHRPGRTGIAIALTADDRRLPPTARLPETETHRVHTEVIGLDLDAVRRFMNDYDTVTDAGDMVVRAIRWRGSDDQ